VPSRRRTIYAIVRAGGKQYRVEPDQVLDVDRLQADVGATIDLADVLLIGGNGDVRVGTPLVEGARVVAEVVEHGRDAKIRVFKYKNKTRYRRRYGHRQPFTRLVVKRIVTGPGEAAEAEAAPPAEKPKPKRARTARTTRAKQAEAEQPPAAEATPEAPPAAEAPAEAEKPRRTRARKTAEPAAAADTEAKPRRTRKAAAEPESETKPRRTTSRRTPKAQAKEEESKPEGETDTEKSGE
jgi:large subunit ribosomal protein L21